MPGLSLPLSTHTLLLFSMAALGLLLSPGPNMVFVISHGISHGPRGGIAAAAGIFGADLVLTLLTAAGVASLLAAWPPAFSLLRASGALYLLWLGAQSLAARRASATSPTLQGGLGRIFRMSALTSLLNPKALLFFLVFLPQFVEAGRGRAERQLLLLGATLSLLALLFHAALGALGGTFARTLLHPSGTTRILRWLPPLVYFALALRLLLVG